MIGEKKTDYFSFFIQFLVLGKCLIIRTNIVKMIVRLATDCVTAWRAYRTNIKSG